MGTLQSDTLSQCLVVAANNRSGRVLGLHLLFHFDSAPENLAAVIVILSGLFDVPYPTSQGAEISIVRLREGLNAIFSSLDFSELNPPEKNTGSYLARIHGNVRLKVKCVVSLPHLAITR
jgi:hypothetical protein